MEPLEELSTAFTDLGAHLLAKGPAVLLGLLIVFGLQFLLKQVRRRLVTYMRKKADDRILVDFTNSIFRVLNVLLLALLFMYIVGLGHIAGTIVGAAGLSAFVIGFALKDIGENFLSGVIMAFDRPFRLGDTIRTGSVEGVVSKLSLRDTHVKTFDGIDVYVPNSQIVKNPLYNYTIDGFIRYSFVVGVDYATDIEQARSIVLEAVRRTPGVLIETKPPRTHVKNLNTSTVDIECHFWIDTFDSTKSGLEIKSQALTRTIAALADAQINMPADIVEIKQVSSTTT